nr:EOG090X0G73 [Megafenestra aurita]
MISTTSGPRSATQRKRQRLDQLVGRIAHLVGSAPIGRIATNSAIVNSLNTGVACVGPLVVSKNKTNQRLHQHRNSNNNNNNNNHHHNNAIRHTHHNNNNNSISGVGVGESDRDDRIVIDQQRGQRICVSLSEEEEEEEEDDEDDNDDDEEEEEEVSVSMESSAGSGESPSPQQQPSPSPASSSSPHSTPTPSSRSPFHATTLGCPPVGTPLGTPLANADNVELSNRRRARSDSDLCDNERLVGQTSSPVAGAVSPAAPASWVLTPATSTSLTSPPQSQQQQQHQQQAGSNGAGQHHSGHLAPRLSRLEHLRPPPLMVSLKRNSSDSTDSSWSPLFGQQESPVDLSVRSASSVSSDTCRHRRRLRRRRRRPVSPVMAAPILLPGSNPGFGCEICGQIFDQHDRLVKHLASRHKLTVQHQHQHQNLQHPHQPQQQQQLQRATAAVNGGSADSGVVVKGYQCDVCQRPFARSDMLTRHMRLHTGLKPYTCRICGQVFSRSDHLSTHQRTHTGEKPYRCPQCSYAACRRDMITRHLRTHTRSEDLDGLSDPRKDSG